MIKIITFFFTLFIGTAQATNLEFLINEAHKLDGQLSNSEEAITASIKRVDKISKFINPSISIGFGSFSNSSTSSGIPDVPKYIDSHSTQSINTSISQNLYNPLKRLDTQEAKAQLHYDRVVRSTIVNDNAIRLIQTNLDRYVAIKQLENIHKEIFLLQTFLSSIEDQESKKLDYLNYKNRLLAAKESLLTNSTNLAQLNSSIINMVGEENAKFHLKLNENFQHDLLKLPPLNQLLGNSFSNNLNIKLKEAEQEISSIRLNRTNRVFRPTIDLTFNASNTIGAPSYPKYKSFSKSIGIQLNIPISDGGANSSAQTDAVSQLNKVNNDIEIAKKQLTKNISDNFFALDNTKKIVAIKNEVIINQLNTLKQNKYLYSNSDDYFLKLTTLETTIAIFNIENDLRRLQKDAIFNWLNIVSATKALDAQVIEVLEKVISIEKSLR
jgi:outer membrane protein TolC